MKRKTKNSIAAILVLMLLAGILAFVFSATSSETKNISPSFSTGSLDSNTGKPIEGKTTLYTKELFECQGLTIQPNYNYYCSFEVYYYREDKSFIGKTTTFSDLYEKGSTFDNAKFARILLIPSLEDGKDDLWFWENWQYSSDITVSVNRDQSFDAPLMSVTEDVYAAFKEHLNGVIYCASAVDNAPFVMTEYNYPSSGTTVKKISVPVVGVSDYTKDSVFTVSVVKKTASGKYEVVRSHELLIPAYKLQNNMPTPVIGENELVDFSAESFEFYNFDVSIKLEAGESLAFGSKTDTVFWAYRKDSMSSDFVENSQPGYVFNSNLSGEAHSELRAYFDVKCLK